MWKSIPWLELLLGPGRFWAGVGCALAAIGGVAYTYGLWYGGVLTGDAAPVREVTLNSSWPGRFQYEADARGVLWRVYRNAPDQLKAEVTYDSLVAADPAAALPGGNWVRELPTEKKTESQPKAPATITHDELIAKLKATGTLRGEPEAAGERVNTVVVDRSLSEPDARALAARLRSSGRPATLVPSTGADGHTVYTVQSGAFASSDQADAYRNELRGTGFIKEPAGGGAGTTGPAGSEGGTPGTGPGHDTNTKSYGTSGGGPSGGSGGGTTKSDDGGGSGPSSSGAEKGSGSTGGSGSGGRKIGDI